MKHRSYRLLLLPLLLLGMASCDQQIDDLISGVLSLDKTIDVTVNVNTDGLNDTIGPLYVQSLAERDTLVGTSCTLTVFDNAKPQIITVTDADNHLLMMYRGKVTDGQEITVNAQTTAQALVSFNPLYGPIPAADIASLNQVIGQTRNYAEFEQAVSNSMARGADMADTNNTFVMALLHNMLREMSEDAFEGQDEVEAAIIEANSFINCYPLVATATDSTLILRSAGNCPSYYGQLTDAEGNTVREVSVVAAPRYAFMDNFSHSLNPVSYGTPVVIPFRNDGTYTLTLSCTEESAVLDFYVRLISNVLATLGADVSQTMITAITPLMRTAVREMDIDVTAITSDEMMKLVVRAYDVVIEYMRGQYQELNTRANWDLGSTLLHRLNEVYLTMRSTTDALLSTSWGFIEAEEEATPANPGVQKNKITVLVSYVRNRSNGGDLIPVDQYDLRIVSGNNQKSKAFGTLNNPLVVEVRKVEDGRSSRCTDATVSFVVEQGGGTLGNSTVDVNVNGRAQTTWTLGSGASGNVQRAYAVVVDENGNEVSGRAYFTALISNERYQVSLCCDWASPSNYASRFYMDVTPTTNESGVVALVPEAGPQWDYNGWSERYEMTGTINNTTKATHMEIAMYTSNVYYPVYSNIHFRTDSYECNLNTDVQNVQGTLIWDGFDHGQPVGAGCGTYIHIVRWNSDIPQAIPAATPKASKGNVGLAVSK